MLFKRGLICGGYMVILQAVYLLPNVTAIWKENNSSAPTCSEKIDLGFILDCSGSVSVFDFGKMRQFVKDLTNYFTISQDQTRVSVMWFSSSAAIDISFYQTFKNKQDFHSAVNNVPYHGGGTNTAGALNLAHSDMYSSKHGARESGSKKILIILTDGQSSGNVDYPAQKLKNSGVIIFSVGIGSGINMQELKIMASFPTDQRVILLQNFNELDALARNMSSKTCKATLYQVKCDKDSITVSFERSNLPHSVNISNLYLGGGMCKADYNKTHIFARTLLKDCGTSYRESDQKMYFTNALTTVLSYSSGVVITREQLFDFRFTCAYDRMKTVGTFHFQPARPRLSVSRSGAGNFTFSLDFFRDNSYYFTYTDNDYPVFKSLSDRIYVQYSVNTSNSDIVIRAVACRATPTNRAYDVPQYEFISGGCDQDKTIRHHTYGLKQLHRFSIQAFRFLIEHRFVYLHCDLLLCNRKLSNSTCARSKYCSNRRRRDVSTNDDRDQRYQLSFGPLMYEKEGGVVKDTESRDSNSNMVLIGSLIGIAILVVVLASALLMMVRRRRPNTHQATTPAPEVLAIENIAVNKE